MILHTGQQPLNMYGTLYYMDSYYKVKKKKKKEKSISYRQKKFIIIALPPIEVG